MPPLPDLTGHAVSYRAVVWRSKWCCALLCPQKMNQHRAINTVLVLAGAFRGGTYGNRATDEIYPCSKHSIASVRVIAHQPFRTTPTPSAPRRLECMRICHPPPIGGPAIRRLQLSDRFAAGAFTRRARCALARA